MMKDFVFYGLISNLETKMYASLLKFLFNSLLFLSLLYYNRKPRKRTRVCKNLEVANLSF